MLSPKLVLIKMIISSVLSFILGFILAHLFQVYTKKWALWDKKIGCQVHHCLFGVILILLSLFFPRYRVELIASGLGVILEHTLKYGFRFLGRW